MLVSSTITFTEWENAVKQRNVLGRCGLGVAALSAVLSLPAQAGLITFDETQNPTVPSPAADDDYPAIGTLYSATQGVSFGQFAVVGSALNTAAQLGNFPSGSQALFYFNNQQGLAPLTMTLDNPDAEFTGQITFFYTTPVVTFTVSFLGDSPPAPEVPSPTPPGNPPNGLYSNWQQYTSPNLDGLGVHTLQISGAINNSAFDDIDFSFVVSQPPGPGPDPTPSGVPAPGSLLLLAAGLVGLRRKERAAA